MSRYNSDAGWIITCSGCGYQTDPDERRLGTILRELSHAGWYFQVRDLCKKCVKQGKANERHRV